MLCVHKSGTWAYTRNIWYEFGVNTPPPHDLKWMYYTRGGEWAYTPNFMVHVYTYIAWIEWKVEKHPDFNWNTGKTRYFLPVFQLLLHARCRFKSNNHGTVHCMNLGLIWICCKYIEVYIVGDRPPAVCYNIRCAREKVLAVALSSRFCWWN